MMFMVFLVNTLPLYSSRLFSLQKNNHFRRENSTVPRKKPLLLGVVFILQRNERNKSKLLFPSEAEKEKELPIRKLFL